MRYYLQLRDRAYGPFADDEIRLRFQNGSLDASSLISTDCRNWREAGSFPEFFDALSHVSPADVVELPPARPAKGATNASESPSDDAPSSDPDERPVWYVSFDGKTGFGPLTLGAIYEAVASGQANADTLVWRGTENARSMRDEPKFSSLFTSTKSGASPVKRDAASFSIPSPDSLRRRCARFLIVNAASIIIPILGILFGTFCVLADGDADLLAGFNLLVFYPAIFINSTLYCVFLLMFVRAFWQTLPVAAAPTTPNKACWFLLIPFFNLYWQFTVFHLGPIAANRSLKELAPESAHYVQVSETLALLYPICAIVCPPLAPILAFFLFAQMRNVGVALAQAQAPKDQTQLV